MDEENIEGIVLVTVISSMACAALLEENVEEIL
jgi:hypothetical protein